MEILGGINDFFGLDIGTTGIRAVQLKKSGATYTLENYAELPVQGAFTQSDSAMDRQKTTQAIRDLMHQAGITAKHVAANIPSQKVFTAIVDMDKMPEADLNKTIRFQADSFIPTPLEQSKIDWAIIGDSPTDPKKVEVLLSSVPNDYVEARLAMIEAAGLNVVALEPDSMALARAVVPQDSNLPQMVLDIGSNSADLVVVMSGVPHLSRAIPVGANAIVRSVVQNLAVDNNQAQQFVFKFGLDKTKLEGRVYHAIVDTVDGLMNEVEKSIKFFQGRYQASKIERIIVTGGASSIPELPVYIANRFALNVEVGNAWRNVSIPQARYNELAAVSNHFSIAVGLAERSE
ncbi:MAG TPA: type IV pilus assembly protein PilM [Candidatus Saccharimonadales bacterium]|nr:type IV pilus assembly protein PilM [Candidatus Saccharimonadales bacterium]